MYKLKLPPGLRAHPIFHVGLLKPAPANAILVTERIKREGDNEFKVEKILNSKELKSGEVKYFIKWKGYPPADNTWEPIKNLTYYNTRL